MNGWSNRATWNAHTLLANDEQAYTSLMIHVRTYSREKFIATASELGGFYEINWDEIFNVWFESL